MIYRYFFPKSGGGWFRRYYQFRAEIQKLEWTTPDNSLYPPITIFDFTRSFDMADAMHSPSTNEDLWRISDDRVIGGYSNSALTFIQTTDCWKQHLQKQKQEQNSKNDNEEKEVGKQENDKEEIISTTNDYNNSNNDDEISNNNSNNTITPYIRWYGTLDTTIGLQSTVQRSGFVAIRSPQLFDMNLRGMYKYIEITCRSNNTRNFIFNLQCESTIPDDIYQVHISFDNNNEESNNNNNNNNNNEFHTFIIPFNEFRLTARGRERVVNRILDDNIKIESLGFVLMDNINDTFQLDILRIRAVNCIKDNVKGTLTVYEVESTPIEKEEFT